MKTVSLLLTALSLAVVLSLNVSSFLDGRSAALPDLSSAVTAVSGLEGRGETPSKSGSKIPRLVQSRNLTRRGCVPELDPQTNTFNGEYDCDKNWPGLQEDMLRNTGLVTNPALLPVYYTGWTEEQQNDPSWAKTILTWLIQYTGTYPENPGGKLAAGFYWYWNALPEGWFSAQLAQIERYKYNPDDMAANLNGWSFPEDADTTFTGCLSEAFARQNVHFTVLLMAPHDYVIGSELSRHWFRIEAPVLTNQEVLERILRVDPRPIEGNDPCGIDIIWERSDPDSLPEPIFWSCPTAEELE